MGTVDSSRGQTYCRSNQSGIKTTLSSAQDPRLGASVRECTRKPTSGTPQVGRQWVLSLSKVEPALLTKSLLEPRVVAYGGKVVVSARVFPEPR